MQMQYYLNHKASPIPTQQVDCNHLDQHIMMSVQRQSMVRPIIGAPQQTSKLGILAIIFCHGSRSLISVGPWAYSISYRILAYLRGGLPIADCSSTQSVAVIGRMCACALMGNRSRYQLHRDVVRRAKTSFVIASQYMCCARRSAHNYNEKCAL